MARNPTAELAERLGRATKPEHFDSAIIQAMGALDDLSRDTSQRAGITLACKEGCFLCCYLRVSATPPEIFLLARHIQRHFTPTEIRQLEQRLNVHDATVRPLTKDRHIRQNVACPLLVEGRCSVHSVRPLGCRNHHSQNFQSCQFAYDHPEDINFSGGLNPLLHRTLGVARAELEGVYTKLGFDMSLCELGTALKEALENPAAWKRWRDHKRPFLSAIPE